MSDFPYDMGDDRTPADDHLDHLLASADAELLTAISAAQAPTGRTWSIKPLPRGAGPGAGPFLPWAEEGSTAGDEFNGAVLIAAEALQGFMDALNAGGHLQQHELARMFQLTASVKRTLLSRRLTKEMARQYFEVVRTSLVSLQGDMSARSFHSLMFSLTEAHRSVSYLFDGAGDYGECPVPSLS